MFQEDAVRDLEAGQGCYRQGNKMMMVKGCAGILCIVSCLGVGLFLAIKFLGSSNI
jgi:hypothetical protein